MKENLMDMSYEVSRMEGEGPVVDLQLVKAPKKDSRGFIVIEPGDGTFGGMDLDPGTFFNEDGGLRTYEPYNIMRARFLRAQGLIPEDK